MEVRFQSLTVNAMRSADCLRYCQHHLRIDLECRYIFVWCGWSKLQLLTSIWPNSVGCRLYIPLFPPHSSKDEMIQWVLLWLCMDVSCRTERERMIWSSTLTDNQKRLLVIFQESPLSWCRDFDIVGLCFVDGKDRILGLSKNITSHNISWRMIRLK